MKRRTLWLAAASLAVLAACATREQTAQPDAKSAEPRLSQLPPVASPETNPTTPEKVALGAKLWVDKRLSGTGNMACTTCHVRDKGWTDGEVLSRKDNGDMNTRHSPTMYNVGYAQNFYWDGRAATLEGQVLAAWRLQTYGDPAKVAANLAAVPGYAAEFQKVFGGPPTQDTIVKALAAYLRAKVSGDSPWDRHEKGQKNAVSDDAKAGFLIFMGKGRCAVCHTPPIYSDFNFHNIGLEGGKEKPDIGRGNVTKKPEDMRAFKTPTLRSAAISGPYFHNGTGKTLEEAVRYMATGGGKDPNKSQQLVDTKLTDQEIKQVVAFLASLTSDEPYMAPKLP